MGYMIKPEVYSAAFPMPSFIADRLLKLMSEAQLKVAIYTMRNSANAIDSAAISKALGISLSETEDALLFLFQNGILSKTEEKAQETIPLKEIVKKSDKPSREDVARRGLEDQRLAMLLREAQLKFSRNLKTNEAACLVWLYDDLGLDVSLILLLLQYAKSENKLNITFIEKTASVWVEEGIENITDAEKWISERAIKILAFKRLAKAFGLGERKPSEKELAYAMLWFDEWKLSDDLLELAYNECIDTKSKFLFGYTAKIIENWHKKGYKCAEDVKKAAESKENKADKNNTRKYDFAGYDLEAFEKMLNED